MIRTVKYNKVNYISIENGTPISRDYESTTTTEIDAKRELKRLYGKNTLFVSMTPIKNVTYELEDKVFFDNAKIIKTENF